MLRYYRDIEMEEINTNPMEEYKAMQDQIAERIGIQSPQTKSSDNSTRERATTPPERYITYLIHDIPILI